MSQALALQEIPSSPPRPRKPARRFRGFGIVELHRPPGKAAWKDAITPDEVQVAPEGIYLKYQDEDRILFVPWEEAREVASWRGTAI